MQPETGASEDIHAILGRFSSWNATQSTNGNGRGLQVGPDEVRELAYEEAIRRYGSWPPVLTTMAKTAASPSQTASQPEASPTMAETTQSTVETATLPSAPAPLDARKNVSAVQENGKIRTAAAATRPSSKKTTSSRRAASSRDRSAGSAKRVHTAIAKKHGAGANVAASLNKKNVAPSAEMHTTPTPKRVATRRTAFREVLADTVEAATAGHPKSERNTRISIRFSSQEESLVRKNAAQAGLTVSAYLRERALQTESPGTVAAADVSVRRAQGQGINAQPQSFSGLGARLAAWLGGLRQRSA